MVITLLKMISLIVLFFILLFSDISLKPIPIESLKDTEITVFVRGAVTNTKSYSLPAFSNVEDLLSMIELDEDADISVLNPNIILKDKDIIDIPKKTEVALISINTGSYDQLITLKGVGDKTAQAIIDHRRDHGLFQTLDELMNVKGIGPKKYADILPYIKL